MILIKNGKLNIALLGATFTVLALTGCQIAGGIGGAPKITVIETLPGEDLQAVLNKGEDLVLRRGFIYEISKTLRYKKPGQKVYTKDARYPADCATLRLINKDEVTLLSGYNVERATLEHVICDGNRYKLSIRPYPESGKSHQPGVINFGGAPGQVVRNCVFMNARGFSNIVFHKGAGNQLIENNLILGAGVDPRGNGREQTEKSFRWSDGISCAAHDSLIRNNLIIDPTDVGIILYCAPGTIAEDNVVAAISRESLGGLNMVDATDHFALNEEKTLFSYRGAIVRNNYIDAFGARIHIGIPIGCLPWSAHGKGKILTGGETTGNTIAGEAAAYGIVAHGITDWTIKENKSTATYSGVAEYGDHKNPPDEPAAFIFDPRAVKASELQPEFKKCDRHIVQLLRKHHAPSDKCGYQQHDYGKSEVNAVVKAAYLEMLGRAPRREELAKGVKQLYAKKLNADGLRRELMVTTEFKERFGEVAPEDLHTYRVKRWFRICNELIRESGTIPSALKLYKEALAALRTDI